MLAILPVKLMGETGFRSITENCLLAVVPPPDSLRVLMSRHWDSKPEGKVRPTG